jgi:hypothetical protein
VGQWNSGGVPYWIGIAYDCGYWNIDIAKDLRDKCQEIGRVLGGMLNKADQFCTDPSNTLQDAPVEYVVNPIATELDGLD